MQGFPFFRQPNSMDCGPTCLRMIAKHYGKNIRLEQLRQVSGFSKEGVSLLGIAEAGENIGFKTKGLQLNFDQLLTEATLPAILHWKQNHFIVITPRADKKKIVVADPAKGLLTYTKDEFCRNWISSKYENGEVTGVALLMEPTPKFYEQSFNTDDDNSSSSLGWARLFSYVKPYKRYFFQIMLALLLGSLIQLVFPFLTQSIVDTGINTQDLSYITIILVAQLMLFFGRTMIEFIRSRLLLHISIRINISILSDFWIKLMRLPVSYFDTKQTGDTLQRIGDHKRIENF